MAQNNFKTQMSRRRHSALAHRRQNSKLHLKYQNHFVSFKFLDIDLTFEI